MTKSMTKSILRDPTEMSIISGSKDDPFVSLDNNREDLYPRVKIRTQIIAGGASINSTKNLV